MAPFVYRCPTTGQRVQGWVTDEPASDDSPGSYVSLSCLACGQTHLVNPATLKVLGADED